MKHLRLFLIRHGQTKNHKQHLFNGWTNVDLTPVGKKQLDAAVAALKDIKFSAVYCSDLARARYGGEALAKNAGLTLHISNDWREMNFGDCEGMTFENIEESYPELAARILNPDGDEIQFPTGESDRSFRGRIAKALANLCDTHVAGNVAVVSHSGVGRAVISEFLQLPLKSMWSIGQNFACLNVIDVYPEGNYVIQLLNGYLGPEGYANKGPGKDFLEK
jgi:alpha-ribazole phosphatase/probable phosphoglycerate mutase